MIVKICMVCGEQFKDGDKIVAVMMSEYRDIDSDVHFAITHPTGCLEIFHLGCYDVDDRQEAEPIEVN
jgi:hypothetical protein